MAEDQPPRPTATLMPQQSASLPARPSQQRSNGNAESAFDESDDDDNELTVRRKNVTAAAPNDASTSGRPSILGLFDDPNGGTVTHDSLETSEEKKVASAHELGRNKEGRDGGAISTGLPPVANVADAWIRQQQQPPPPLPSLSPPAQPAAVPSRPLPVDPQRSRSPRRDGAAAGAAFAASPTTTPPASSSSNPQPTRHGHHQRNVSWNMKDTVVLLDRPRALGERQISDFSAVSSLYQSDVAAAAAALSASTNNAATEYERLSSTRNHPHHYHHIGGTNIVRPNGLTREISGSSRRKITSAEMIRDHLHQQSPLESEAEAYILQAIEKSDPPRPRSDSSNAVLPGIPDEAILNMTLPSSSSPPVPPTSGSVDVSVDGNNIGGDGGGGGGGFGFPPGDLASLEGTTVTTMGRSQGGQQHHAYGSGSNASARRPPLSRPNAITYQKRQQTMEEKLCGLTTELDMIQLSSASASQLPQPNGKPTLMRATSEALMNGHRSRAGTLESIPSDRGLFMADDGNDDPVVATGGSAVDTFQQSTGILYRRMKKDGSDRNQLNPPPPTASSAHHHGGSPLDSSSLESWVKSASARFLPGAMHKKSDEIDDDGKARKDSGDLDDDDVELQSIQEGDDEDLDGTSDGKQNSSTGRSDPGGSGMSGIPSIRRRRPGSRRKVNQSKQQSYTEEWKLAHDFMDTFKLMNRPLRLFLKAVTLYIMIPAIVISAILFYFTGNPPTGILQNGGNPINGTLLNTRGQEVDPDTPSVSWWLLFICVRQLLMLLPALLMDMILIDFFAIRSGVMYKVFGAWATLFVLQSRGWPFVMFFWCVFDFALLYGSARFFQHWLFWQHVIPLLNGSNPSGHIVDSMWYHRMLSIAICISAVVAVKRFIIGIFFGKKTFQQYSDKLATVMGKIILISQVAHLAQDIERQSRAKVRNEQDIPRESVFSRATLTEDRLGALFQTAEDGSEGSAVGRSDRSLGWDDDVDNKLAPVIDPDDRHPLTGKLNAVQKSRIVQLLGSWEEPTTSETTVELVSVSALLHFRRALACLRTDFPFSSSFGPAGTREDTITSSQDVYERLLLGSDDMSSCLHFNVLATLGVFPDDSLDQDKLVDLIRIFRPDRDGTLSVVDFVKSIDTVYRELRLLRASVNNSTKIDKSFENIFNIIFYGLIVVVVLSQLGFDPLAMFLSISGVILAFAFMIGAASSKYFEGVLFILIRRPYEIGDGIHVSDVNIETPNVGSDCWVVKDVSLFATTVVFVRTKEIATMSNGSLAASRIINSSRSHHASLYCLIKFPISMQYNKLKVFQDALQTYIRNRPREWLGFTTFRVNRVVTEEGFIEYMFVGTHRESWYHLGTLRDSLGSLLSFTVELSKKLDITYQKPAMPVNMSMVSTPNFPAAMPSLALSDSGEEPILSPRSKAGSMDYSTDLRGLHDLFAPAREFKHGHGKEHS